MEHELPKVAILWLFDNQRDIQSKSGLTVNEFIECMAEELCSQSKDTSNIDCYFFENSDDGRSRS